MSKHNLKPMTVVMRELKASGYDRNYRIEKGRMILEGTDKSYGPEDVTVEQEFRFEGDSNPSDMAILYKVSCSDGTKGMLVCNYGPQADPANALFVLSAEKANTGTQGH